MKYKELTMPKGKYIMTEEHKRKLSESHKGKKHSIEHIEKQRTIMKKIWLNEEYRKKISESHLGHPVSEETRLKIGIAHKGEKHPFYNKRRNEVPSWKGGRTIDKDGYTWIRIEHPNSHNGYFLEHRLVVEQFIGRLLTKEEVIHHIDENKKNNDLNNLMIFPNNQEHMRWHTKLRRYGYLTNPMKRQIENRWKEYGK